MAEVGLVKEVKGDYVVVGLVRNEACGHCKACSVGLQETEMILEADNQCHAEVGDLVEIYLKEENFLKAVFIMYSIPLIGLLLGIGLGYLLFNHELLIIATGLLLMSLTFVLIRLNEERFKTDKFRPIAIRNTSDN